MLIYHALGHGIFVISYSPNINGPSRKLWLHGWSCSFMYEYPVRTYWLLCYNKYVYFLRHRNVRDTVCLATLFPQALAPAGFIRGYTSLIQALIWSVCAPRRLMMYHYSGVRWASGRLKSPETQLFVLEHVQLTRKKTQRLFYWLYQIKILGMGCFRWCRKMT